MKRYTYDCDRYGKTDLKEHHHSCFLLAVHLMEPVEYKTTLCLLVVPLDLCSICVVPALHAYLPVSCATHLMRETKPLCR